MALKMETVIVNHPGVVDANNNEIKTPVEEDTNNNEDFQDCEDFEDCDSSPPPSTSEIDDYDKIYESLINEAPYIPGDDGGEEDSDQIEWLNPKLIREGQNFVKNNFFSLICAHIGALLYGFSFKRLSTVLLRNQRPNGINDTLIRYLSTFVHLKTWYESDLIGNYKNGAQDVRIVRKMHRLAYKHYQKMSKDPPRCDVAPTPDKELIVQAIIEDLKCVETPETVPQEVLTYSPLVPMSQFDMVMTQFGTMSLVYLFPGTLGIKNPEGLDGFLHLWAVVGRLLGIQDRFNVALYPNREMYMRIFKNIGMTSLKESDMAIVSLQKEMVDGVAKYAQFMTVKSLLYFGLKTNDALQGYKGTHLYKIMSWKDYFYYLLMRIVLSSIYHCDYLRKTMNWVARSVLFFAKRYYMPRRGKGAKA